MTIRPAGMTGAVCAAITALLLVSMSAPASAQLSLTPAAQNAPKAKVAPKVASKPAPVAATSERARKAPNRMPHWNTYTMGNADLAFLSANQYLDLSAYDGVIWVVHEHEFSLLDFAAGDVRIVDPDDLSEIDLANDPKVLLAQASASEDAKEAKPVYQIASAQPAPQKGEEDDGILNRILMTFAGALAVAGAMKMLFA
jgi:hypothetical protein